jgi:hypothetical protein
LQKSRFGESHVYPPLQKYSLFSFPPNHLHIPHRLVPWRGGSRSSRTRGGMRWTRAHQARERDGRASAKACERSNGARTNDVAQRTAKSCGPDAPTLASRRRKAPLPNRALGGASFRRRRWQTSPVTGESAKETVKTIACGNAGCSGVSAVTTRVLSTFAHGAAGAAGTRRSPRPLFFWAEGSVQNSGARRRGNAESYLTVIASEAKQSILSLWLHGLLRFARNDELKTPCALAV